MSLKFYVTGTLVGGGKIKIQRRVDMLNVGSVGSGSVAGVAMYEEVSCR